MFSLLLMFGLVTSSSSKATFFPVRAKVKARLSAIKLLPSPAIVDVTNIFLKFALFLLSVRDTLSCLNCSAINVLSFFPVTMGAMVLLWMISPITGWTVKFSISCLNNTLLLKVSLMAIVPIPAKIGRAKASKYILLGFGLTGYSEASAWSTIVALGMDAA